MIPSPTHRRSRGYSLVEVMLASTLMAGVLVCVSSLFVMGSKSVKAGRELTKATTIANSAMEQVLAWNYEKVWALTGGVSTDSTKVLSTLDATPAYTGTPSDVADMTAAVDTWRERASTELQDGYVTYKVDGLDGLPTALSDGLSAYDEADMLRVTITVFWMEGPRARHVVFEGFTL